MNLETSKTPVAYVSCKSSEFDNESKRCPYYKSGHFSKFGRHKIFTNVPFSYVKFDEKNDGEVDEAVRPTVFKFMHIFPADTEPRSTKNVATSILTQEKNSGTSKTPVTLVSCQSNESTN